MKQVLAAVAIVLILLLGAFFWTTVLGTVAAVAGRTSSIAMALRDAPAERARAVADRTEGAYERAEDTVSDRVTAARNQADEALNAISDVPAARARAATDRAEDVWETLKETPAQKVSEGADALREAVAEQVERAADSLERAAERIDPDPPNRSTLADEELADEEPANEEPAVAPAPVTAARPLESAKPATGPQIGSPREPELTVTPVRSAAGSGRSPWVLLPQPEPGRRVAAGPLVVEARGRGDAPITQVRLTLDGAPLSVTLEQRDEATWRGHATARVAPGPHVVNAFVVDTQGRTGSHRWSFTAAAP